MSVFMIYTQPCFSPTQAPPINHIFLPSSPHSYIFSLSLNVTFASRTSLKISRLPYTLTRMFHRSFPSGSHLTIGTVIPDVYDRRHFRHWRSSGYKNHPSPLRV